MDGLRRGAQLRRYRTGSRGKPSYRLEGAGEAVRGITDGIVAELQQDRILRLSQGKRSPTFDRVDYEWTGKELDEPGSPGYPQYNEIDVGRIGVQREPPKPPGKPVAPRDIIDYVRRNFRVPVKGKATHPTGMRAGWFDPHAVGIRMVDLQNLGTAIHELGHYIDWHLEESVERKPPSAAIRQELLDLGKALYGKRKPPGGYKSEGWAEFLRLYLTGEEAKSKAPRCSITSRRCSQGPSRGAAKLKTCGA